MNEAHQTYGYETMPEGLAEIADHGGLEAALAIALAHGGRPWRVPAHRDSEPGRELVELVGTEAAQALIAGCGGDVLDVPIARRHVVLWLAAKGWSVTRIAARLHMTAGSVRRYIRESGTP